jgi:hypothetical protein
MLDAFGTREAAQLSVRYLRPTESDMTETPFPSDEKRDAKRRAWKVFSAGLIIRLFGVALIGLGDGHDSLFWKVVVVSGVILLIGGTTVLRYLLLSGPLSRLSALIKKRWSANAVNGVGN